MSILATTEKVFSTPDLHLSAFLQAKGKTVLRTERSGRRVFFVFEDSKGQCENLERSFWNGEGTISARAFSNSLSTLKNWLFSDSRKMS